MRKAICLTALTLALAATCWTTKAPADPGTRGIYNYSPFGGTNGTSIVLNATCYWDSSSHTFTPDSVTFLCRHQHGDQTPYYSTDVTLTDDGFGNYTISGTVQGLAAGSWAAYVEVDSHFSSTNYTDSKLKVVTL